MESKNSPEFRKPLHLLPHEVIEEILSKLPVKSLLKFRCVSKSWIASINSRFFIKKSLQNSTEQRAISPNDDPNNYHLLTDSIVVGSCINGLLCILKEKTFFLWNPSIRTSIELPRIELSVTRKYGFGWDEESDAYLVFAVVSEKEENVGKVHSTKTNSWKTVDHGCLSLYCEDGIFSCGMIHWLTQGDRDIESFDLKSEVFGMIEKPCEPSGDMWVYDKDGCLGVLCEYNETRLDFWVMKKYGVKESWVIRNTAPIPPKYYKSNYLVTLNRDDKGMEFMSRGTDNIFFINESLVSPVWNSRQDEIEQEQIQAVAIAEDRPRRQSKTRPACVNKRKAAGCSVELTKESEEIEQEEARTSVVEGHSKRQKKKRAERCGVKGTKENQEMEHEQVLTSVAEGRPRRRTARYGDQGSKENPDIEKEQVHATCVKEGRPKRQNKRNELVQERAHTRVAEGRPRRSTARYGDQGTKENPEIGNEQVRATCVNKCRPKRQNNRKEMEQEQAQTGIAQGRPRRSTARYADQGT